MSSYIQIRPDGSIVELDDENEKHRYLATKGNKYFEDVEELADSLRKAQSVVGWLDNVRDY